MKLTKEHRAAIDKLSLKPGVCRVEGCGETLICCTVDPTDHSKKKLKISDIPPPRFGCPEHDVWLGFCFDEGYPDDKEYKLGLYEATLRDVADPSWHWLPESMRAAAVKAGFGMRDESYPRFLLAAHDGRAWTTDRRLLIDIGPAAEAEAALARSGIEVYPAAAKPAEMARYRLPDEALAGLMSKLVEYQPATFRAAEDAGLAPEYKGAVVAGETVVAGYYVEMVNTLYPGVEWFAKGRLDPLVARQADGSARAVLMPIDVEAAQA